MLETLTRGFGKARERLAGLRELHDQQPLITEVRGRGLMLGFDVTDQEAAAAVERECFERGLLVLTCGQRGIRLAPPLVVTANQAEVALKIVRGARVAVAG